MEHGQDSMNRTDQLQSTDVPSARWRVHCFGAKQQLHFGLSFSSPEDLQVMYSTSKQYRGQALAPIPFSSVTPIENITDFINKDEEIDHR